MFFLKKNTTEKAENFVAPPYTNRGVQNTGRIGLRACLDWLQATFKNVQDPHIICDLLFLDRALFTQFNIGKYGYSSHIRFGNISIYYNGQANMGCHLEMTGQGCREYESLRVLEWDKLLSMLVDMDNVNITRLDVAIDDFLGYFSIKQIKDKIRRAHVVSRFKEAREMNKYKLADGSTTGETVYFGNPSSDLMVRFYNKKLERESNKKDVLKDIWVRTELQLRRKRAENFARTIAYESNTIGEIAAGVLKNYIRFLVPNKKDKNKSRWKTAPFWENFLGDVKKVKLTMVAPDYTIDRAKRWLEHSVSPTLYTVLSAYDWDIEILIEMINNGAKRINEKQKNAISQFKIAQENELENINELKLRKKLQGLKSGRFEVNENGEVILKPRELFSNQLH